MFYCTVKQKVVVMCVEKILML